MSKEKIEITLQVDKNAKEVADKIFEELGIDTETAINMFLKQSVRMGGIPFMPNVHRPHMMQPHHGQVRPVRMVKKGNDDDKTKS